MKRWKFMGTGFLGVIRIGGMVLGVTFADAPPHWLGWCRQRHVVCFNVECFRACEHYQAWNRCVACGWWDRRSQSRRNYP
ncbi:DUF1515 family protein [Rhizobium sp. TRM96647]|uniref:DUF1515 family protein n=1 Tax=unclassified Rhizobium TaxID=2613769 RepID=UPI00399677CF